MPTVNGNDTILCIGVEATAGTPIELGAGDQIDMIQGDVPDPNVLVHDDDSLTQASKKDWNNKNANVFNLETMLQYWGHERLLAVLMGSCTATAHATHPLVGYLEFNRGSLEKTLTVAAAQGEGPEAADIARVLELSGLLLSEVEITQDNNKRAACKWVGIAKDQTEESTTNTTATIENATMIDAAAPMAPAVFGDATVRLAQQDAATFGSGQNIDADKFSLKIMSGVPTEVERHLTTEGMATPTRLNKYTAEFMVSFLRDNAASQVFRDLVKSSEKLKALVIWEASQGTPGISVSAASPSTNISGSSNTKLNIRITDEVTSDYEEYEITLTVGSLDSGAAIATAIQTAVRAATVTSQRFQRLLDNFSCDYDGRVDDKYSLWIDNAELVKVEVVAASATDLAVELKLGTPGSGYEAGSVADLLAVFMPEVKFNPPATNIQAGVNPLEFEGRCKTSYGATAPAGFTSSETMLSADLDGDANQDLRIVKRGRVLTSPLA